MKERKREIDAKRRKTEKRKKEGRGLGREGANETKEILRKEGRENRERMNI